MPAATTFFTAASAVRSHDPALRNSGLTTLFALATDPAPDTTVERSIQDRARAVMRDTFPSLRLQFFDPDAAGTNGIMEAG